MGYFNETASERLFRESGPFFHLCTQPLESDVFFPSEEERKLALNYIAVATTFSQCTLLALAIMSNHFHFILMGKDKTVSFFWQKYRQLLDSYFRHHGRRGLMDKVEATPIPINNLQQLRTEIAYVIRNPFVAQTNVHVFAYPWASGFLYFNPLLEKSGVPASSLKGRALRAFTRSRGTEALSGKIMVKDGMAQMWSFVDYQLAESFYDNARQFIHSVLKNVEAMAETSRRMGDNPFFSDEELRPVLYSLCRDLYNQPEISKLENQARKTISLRLKYEYFASNKQIARLTKLALREVDAIFPLGAGERISGA